MILDYYAINSSALLLKCVLCKSQREMIQYKETMVSGNRILAVFPVCLFLRVDQTLIILLFASLFSVGVYWVNDVYSV